MQNRRNNKRDSSFSKRTNNDSSDNTRRSISKRGPRIGKSRVSNQQTKSWSKAKDTKKQQDIDLKSGPVRLNKYISNSGICSRREADTYISAGVVKVNGKVVTEMGYKVQLEDRVEFEGQVIKNESKVYIILNKPKGFICSVNADRAEPTVIDIVKNKCSERVYPVGKLDKSTTGVLLLTNDGDLTKKLTQPSSKVKKIYQVTLEKSLTKADMEKLASGVMLEEGKVHAEEIAFPDPEDRKKVGVEVRSSRNRVIQRMFEALDYNVKGLDRVYYAGLTKKNVSRGRYRFLTESEVKFLKMK